MEDLVIQVAPSRRDICFILVEKEDITRSLRPDNAWTIWYALILKNSNGEY